MSREQFKKKLKKGEEVERKLVEYLKKKYPKTYKIEGENKDGDIVIPEIKKTIEVKNDIGSKDSNNYFIEFSCNKKDSGIASTKADYWVIYDEFDCMWIETGRLRTMCRFYGKYWEGIPKGEKSTIKAYLVPQNILKDNSDLIKNGKIYDL